MIRWFICGRRKGTSGLISWMVAILLPLWASVTGESAQDPPTSSHPWIGKPAPPVELRSLSGEKVSLTSFTGRKFVILHFASSW
jgi:hypothetical protein